MTTGQIVAIVAGIVSILGAGAAVLIGAVHLGRRVGGLLEEVKGIRAAVEEGRHDFKVLNEQFIALQAEHRTMMDINGCTDIRARL